MKIIKQTALLFLTLCIYIVLADSGIIDLALFPDNPVSQSESIDFTNETEQFHTHSINFDDLLISSSRLQRLSECVIVSLKKNKVINFTNNFTSCIWQPPQLS